MYHVHYISQRARVVARFPFTEMFGLAVRTAPGIDEANLANMSRSTTVFIDSHSVPIGF